MTELIELERNLKGDRIMKQYIDKAALVAEIERRMKSIRMAFSMQGILQGHDRAYANAQYDAFNSLLSFLVTLEVKEVQEEPVSEDLANAAIEYCGGDKGSDARVRAAFVVGANWKKEQIMKNNFSMEVFYETEWDDIHKFLRKNLNGEKVKLVIIKE